MKAIQTVGVLIFQDEKVLLVRHGEAASHLTGWYGVPAGRPEENESLLRAAVRELHEETGLVTHASTLIQLRLKVPDVDIPRKDGTTKRFTIRLFYCQSYTGQLQSSAETIPEWVAIAKIDSLQLIGYTKRIIEEGYAEVKSLL